MDENFLKMIGAANDETEGLSKEDGELALRLMRAYFAVSDTEKRKQIVKLAEEFAETSSAPNKKN